MAKLKRSANKKIAGVCAGLAEYFTIMRAAYALLTLLFAGFPGVILYIILMFVMPEADK